MNWILERLKEPTTWRGIVVLAGLAGLKVSPDQMNAIAAAVVALLAAIEMFRKEAKPV